MGSLRTNLVILSLVFSGSFAMVRNRRVALEPHGIPDHFHIINRIDGSTILGINGAGEIEPLIDTHEIHSLQEQGVYKFWFSACDFIGDQFKLCQAGDLSKIIYYDCSDPRGCKYSVTQNLAEKNQITDIQNILYGNQDQIPMMARVVEKASSRFKIIIEDIMTRSKCMTLANQDLTLDPCSYVANDIFEFEIRDIAARKK